MADCCLARPCGLCGVRIIGGNWHCPKCNICICASCALRMHIDTVKCPKCGKEIKD